MHNIRNTIFNLTEAATSINIESSSADNLLTTTRSALTITDSLGNNASIIPAVSKVNATNYLTRSYTNWESGDATGYIEISFYHNGSAGIRTLFATGSTAASARYFRIYSSTNTMYFAVRSNISTVFSNLLYLTSAVSTGWHVLRFTSAAGTYTATLDGGNAPLSVSSGLNDGRWLNMVPTRNTLEIGVYTDSGGVAASATDFNIRYIDYNNKHKWYTHGQGNKVFDLIGTDHFTWTGTSHTTFDSNGDTTLLDSGFSIWKSYGVIDEYVPYKGGVAYDVSSFLTGYTKYTDHVGSATVHNLAPSLVDFDPADTAPAVLIVLDRSNTTYQTDASRSSAYYDSGNKYRYHITELANPITYNALFKTGHKGKFYTKITSSVVSLNYYPTSITSFKLYSKDRIRTHQRKIMDDCGSNVFYAVIPGDNYDADGYNIVLLTDIRQFGANSGTTPELNHQYIQKAAYYPYGSTMSFGSAGEIYTVSQPVYLDSYKTYTINSTIKIKSATITRLTTNYAAGENHIHVVDTTGFNVGEWVGLRDTDCTYDYNLWWGWNTWITAVDPVGKTITFNSAEGASCIYNYTTAKDAYVGHAQSVFIAENKTDITLTGTGLIDCNQVNQSPINGLLPTSVFEELRSTSGAAFWICDNITISNLNFINGLRHNICISGTSTAAATRCDHIHISNVTSTFAHNKNCNIRYCDNVTVEDYIGDDAIWEDGLMFYLGNSNCVINRITCRRNGRNGIGWNSLYADGLTGGTLVTQDNVYAGIGITGKNVTLTGITMRDRLGIAYAYANATGITLTNVAIANYTADPTYYNGSIVCLQGEIKNIALNELSITNCNGIGIYTTKEYTPANPPVNVDVTGGGLYNHTGTTYTIEAGTDIVFSDFDNAP
jgi:hypothetical protein